VVTVFYISGVASPKYLGWPKIWGSKSFDFRRATVFRLGHPLSKHKMTMYSKIGGRPPCPSFWLRLCSAYCRLQTNAGSRITRTWHESVTWL